MDNQKNDIILNPAHYCTGRKYEPRKVIWRPVRGFEGLYEVSNTGLVKSLERYVKNKNGVRKVESRILKPKYAGEDKKYYAVALCRNGKIKYKSIHRIVAEAFIPNKYNLPEINHKDENPQNNNMYNLEWCDRKYNTNYGTHNERVSNTKSKSLEIIDSNNNIVKKYRNAKDASRDTGFCQSGITHCCNGRLKSFKGFIWRYCCE